MALESDLGDLIAEDRASMRSADPAPADVGSGIDDLIKEDRAFRKSGSAAPERKAASSPATPRRTSAPTRYQRAVSTPPAPEPELSWGETGRQAVKNALPSAGGVLKATADAFAHPIKTAGTLADVGKGAISQAAGAVGLSQDPVKKSQAEGLVRALEDHYKQTYGSMKGFKKALATDPASILMDASTVLTGGGGAAAKLPGMAGKIGATAVKAGSLIDPVQAALRVAKMPIKAASHITAPAQSLSSGASHASLLRAAEAGASKNPEVQQAFRAAQKGDIGGDEIIGAVNDAYNAISKERGTNYVNRMKAEKTGTLPALDWAPVQDALKSNLDDITLSDAGVTDIYHEGAGAALGEIADRIGKYAAAPAGSKFHTLEGFDALKKSVGDIRQKYRGDPVAHQKATSMYNAIKDAVADAHPEYAKIMEEYAAASDDLTNMKRELGAGNKKLAESTVLRKILKTKPGGKGESMLAALSEYDPKIPYMIAGHELSPLFPQGVQKAVAPLLSATLAGTGNVPLALAQGLSSSPRIMGSMNYRAGQVGKVAKDVTQPAVTDSAYYLGRAQDEDGEEDGPNATGLEPAPPEDPSDTFTKMLHIESGNKQFKNDGSLVVSPVGAIGAAQVMPKTGPEAAEAAGVDWDLDRLKSDEDYNKLLGRAYFEKMRDIFEGDELLAAAAYNAGPGAVKRALRRGGDWRNHLPAETQNYVAMLEPDRLQRASGGKVGHEHLVNRLVTRVKAAKRATDKTTEPLLKSDDSAIAHALHIAQQSI